MILAYFLAKTKTKRFVKFVQPTTGEQTSRQQITSSRIAPLYCPPNGLYGLIDVDSDAATREWLLSKFPDADIGSIKYLHTLFDKYLDNMLVQFEQNRMVQTINNFELFDKKWLTIFDKGLTPF